MTDDQAGMTPGESTTPTAVAPPPPPAAPGRRDGSAASGGKKSRTWLWILIAVAAVLLLAGGWWLWTASSQTTVPRVVGMSQKEAEAALTQASLRAGAASEVPTLAVAPGTVVDQKPVAGVKVAKDSRVDLGVASIPLVAVPDVSGKTESDASVALAESGLFVGAITYVNDPDIKAGYVKSQDPLAGSTSPVATKVDLTVSKGPQTGQVPNVVGLTQADAEATLQGAGFKVNTTQAESANVPAGNVISQSPSAGVVLLAGSPVNIVVSTGKPATPKSTVPDVVGQTVAAAVDALTKANLKYAISFTVSAENVLKVAAQDPAAGQQVEPGSVVLLKIGLPGFLLSGGQLPEKPSTTPTVQPLPSTPPAAPSTTPSVSVNSLPTQPQASVPTTP